MALFTWNEKFTVKVEEFDVHHKKIIDMINQLHQKMMIGRGRDVVKPLLMELKEYTKYHFAAEEIKMEKFAYPKRVEHKAQHKFLIEKLDDFFKRQEMNEAELTIDFFVFLKDWLLEHIGKVDKDYSGFFNSHGVS